MTSRSDFIRILSESILIMNGWLLSAAVLNQWMWILGKQNERLSRRLGARDAVASRPHDSIGPGAAAAAADDAQGRACMHARSLLHLYNPVASTIRCCRPRQPNPTGQMRSRALLGCMADPILFCPHRTTLTRQVPVLLLLARKTRLESVTIFMHALLGHV